jgi:hypothetical protein
MKTERIHSLDAMRAILMLLGVYFHLSLPYANFGDGSGWVRDPNSTSEFFNFVYSTLHYFRMHGFFLIAGFFGALLYQKRGAKKMMANRVKRILLPLLVMIAPISIMNAYFRNFSFERNEGHSILESFSRSFSIFAFPDIWELFPWTTAHLWFLNYLFFMSLFAYLLKSIISKYTRFHSIDDGNPISNTLRKLISNLFLRPWTGTLLVCFIYGSLMMVLIKPDAQGSGQWWDWFWFTKWEAIKTFIAFGFFYFLGWHMYHHKDLINHVGLKRQSSIFITYATLLTGLMFGVFTLFPYSGYPHIHYGWGRTYDVTLSVDMSTFDFEKFYEEGNELRGVFVNGYFSDWCGECDNAMMEDIGDGIYTKKVQMHNGDHKFIFSINGWDGAKRDEDSDYEEWVSPGKEGLDCDVAPEFKEYVIQVFKEDIILDTICWKQCTDCDGNMINLTSDGIKEPLWEHPVNLIYLFLWNSGVPLYIMLVMAICLRFFKNQSKRMRYISDASYWVYIIHLPATHFVPGLFHGVAMNVFLKFIISSILVTMICFLSYHYFVRGTFIGKFLNGRKY